jgi:hypothetical protein
MNTITREAVTKKTFLTNHGSFSGTPPQLVVSESWHINKESNISNLLTQGNGGCLDN